MTAANRAMPAWVLALATACGPAVAETPAATATPPAATPSAENPAPAANKGASGGGAEIAWGAPVSGLCFVARSEVMNRSAAGAAATRRLEQLSQSAKAELGAEEKAIRVQQKALQAQAPSLPPQTLQQKGEALARRGQALQQAAQVKTAQLGETQKAAEQRIEAVIGQILPSLVASHHCAAVFERGVTYGSNPQMDLTAEVIAEMDRRLPSFPVELAPAPKSR